MIVLGHDYAWSWLCMVRIVLDDDYAWDLCSQFAEICAAKVPIQLHMLIVRSWFWAGNGRHTSNQIQWTTSSWPVVKAALSGNKCLLSLKHYDLYAYTTREAVSKVPIGSDSRLPIGPDCRVPNGLGSWNIQREGHSGHEETYPLGEIACTCICVHTASDWFLWLLQCPSWGQPTHSAASVWKLQLLSLTWRSGGSIALLSRYDISCPHVSMDAYLSGSAYTYDHCQSGTLSVPLTDKMTLWHQ